MKTKTQWTVDRCFGLNGSRAIINESGNYVCEILEEGHDIGQLHKNEADYCCRLISAAPELLEACKEIENQLTQSKRNANGSYETHIPEAMASCLRKAIAKADKDYFKP